MTEVEQQAPAPTTEAPAKEEVVEEKKVEAEAENKEEEKKDEEKKEEPEKEVLEPDILLHTFQFYITFSFLYHLKFQSNFYLGQERKERKGQEGKGAKRTCSTSTTSSTQKGFRKGHCLFVPISSLPQATKHFSEVSQSRNLVEAPWNQI